VPPPTAVGASSDALLWRSLSSQHAQRPPRQIRPSPRSILARGTRHPKAHSLWFLWAHNFLACYLCHLVRIAAPMIIAHPLSRREPERDDHRVTRTSPVPFRPRFHPLFMLSHSLRSSRAKAPSSLKREDFPAFPILALPTLPERCDRDSARGPPRSAPALNADKADVTDQRAKSAACALKHGRWRVRPGAAHRSRPTPCLRGIERGSRGLSPSGHSGMRPPSLDC
jgi:hypothetical protein